MASAPEHPVVVDRDTHLDSRVRVSLQLVTTNVFGTNPLYPAQLDVLVRLALMKFKSSTFKPSPVVFVHLTGGGKLLVRDVHSVLFRGVSLTIIPVLSLGADLAEKVKQKASQTCGRIISIHLNKFGSNSDATSIIELTLALPLDTKKTVLLFFFSSGDCQ